MSEIKLTKEDLELAKSISNEIWDSYDDTHGYASEKKAINSECSVLHPDNIWFFWQQFDADNQGKFYQKVTEHQNNDLLKWTQEQLAETNKAIAEMKKMGFTL